MDAHIVLINRTLILYLYSGHTKWTLNKGGDGMPPCPTGSAIPSTAGGSGSCSLRYLGYFPSPFMSEDAAP